MKVEELKKKIKECKEFDRSFLKAELKGHLDERAEIKKKIEIIRRKYRDSGFDFKELDGIFEQVK